MFFHSKIVGPKIIALHIKCCKGLIAYHKSNGIIATKIHVDMEHGVLLKKYVEEVNNCPRPSLKHELIVKCLHVTPTTISRFFFSTSKFLKDHKTSKSKNLVRGGKLGNNYA